jgi:formate dehydrogenase subunit delta
VNIDQLVSMANEIATFFDSTSDPEQATTEVLTHLKRFWDPRMRTQIADHYRGGGGGLVGAADRAVALLTQENP